MQPTINLVLPSLFNTPLAPYLAGLFVGVALGVLYIMVQFLKKGGNNRDRTIRENIGEKSEHEMKTIYMARTTVEILSLFVALEQERRKSKIRNSARMANVNENIEQIFDSLIGDATIERLFTNWNRRISKIRTHLDDFSTCINTIKSPQYKTTLKNAIKQSNSILDRDIE